MAIEDFEWEGNVEVTPPSPARLTASAEPALGAAPGGSGWFSGLRKSVWLEPAMRLFGMALLLGVLAGIGVVATTYAKPGVKLPGGSRLLADALGTSWLKPSPPDSHAPAAAVSAKPASLASASMKVSPAAAKPTSAEAGSAAVDVSGAVPDGAGASGVTTDGKVILNLASADELTKLPGVGMKRAQAILALRTKLKRFKHPTDLLRVKGIGPRGLQRMLPHLVLDAPGPG
jgi:competence protein ComEA